MNTVVFVMMALTTGSNWVPTLEFRTQQLCEVAAAEIKRQVEPKVFLGSLRTPFCVRIEK